MLPHVCSGNLPALCAISAFSRAATIRKQVSVRESCFSGCEVAACLLAERVDLYFCYEADWLREVKSLLTVGAQSEVNVNVESVVSCRHLGHMLTTRNVRIICYEINFR